VLGHTEELPWVWQGGGVMGVAAWRWGRIEDVVASVVSATEEGNGLRMVSSMVVIGEGERGGDECGMERGRMGMATVVVYERGEGYNWLVFKIS